MTADINSLLPVIRSQFSKIKLCSTHDKVYKDECVYSFDTPYSIGGLYVNIVSLLGYGSKYIQYDVAKGGKLYLHQKWNKTLKHVDTNATETPSIANTLKTLSNEDSKYNIEKIHSLVVVTENGSLQVIALPNLQLPEFVSNVVQSIIDHEGMKANLSSGTDLSLLLLLSTLFNLFTSFVLITFIVRLIYF